jgi:hypothetical protein
MSTAQLIVVGYAALAVEGVLLFQALEGSATALILAILVAAAVLIYFLKPHPMARKLVVVGAMVLPFAVFTGWYWGWPYYQQRRLDAQAERVDAEWVKANVPEQWQREYRQQFPGASSGQLVVAWNLAQEQQVEAEKAKQQAAAKEAEEKARASARLKVGDRIWVLSDSYAARDAAVYFPHSPRLYGTVVDTDFHANQERYAVKWDGYEVLKQISWLTSRDGLNLVRGK